MPARTAVQGIAAITLVISGYGSARAQDDPFAWMEEAHSPRAMEWVQRENARSLAELRGDRRYAELHAQAAWLWSADNSPLLIRWAGGTILRNMWGDADRHPRGVWRQTTLDSFRTGTPAWEVLLDIDALAKAENRNWLGLGAHCLAPEYRHCLLSLSEGGEDAAEIREFDTVARRFVTEGFRIARGYSSVEWLDADTVVVAADWGPDTITQANYPYVVKLWKRGVPFERAEELFRGSKSDFKTRPFVLRDRQGEVRMILAARSPSTTYDKLYVLQAGKSAELPIPTKNTLVGILGRQLIVSIGEDWPRYNLKGGDVVACDIAQLKSGSSALRPELIVRPDLQAGETINPSVTASRLVVTVKHTIRNRLYSYTRRDGRWIKRRIELPPQLNPQYASAPAGSDTLLISGDSLLEPPSYWIADAAGKIELLRTEPARFRSDELVVERFSAVSPDGTKIPYTVIRSRTMKFDGSTPTVLTGYGGYGALVQENYYSNLDVGKLWLERGGAYVISHIRGGGEFGPAWHHAAMRENRQRAYDDFFAVSEDLIRRGITSPERLGITGSSNGGLLMGVAFTQRPELYSAVIIDVPLLDMLRFTKMGVAQGTGVSLGTAEFGDPENPADRAWLSRYSPYHRLQADRPYPEPFLISATNDVRTPSGHARKFAARLQELGYPFLYFENNEGGHGAAGDMTGYVDRLALEFTYLSRKLGL